MKKETKKSALGRKTLLLLDMHALLHRAYHALPPFRSKGGEPTGALYGFISMFLRALGDTKPDYVAAAFDLPGPTFRHTAYEKYKAQRAKTDDDLVSQLKRAHDVVRVLGIPDVSLPGFEADDMIGTIVEKVKEIKNLTVVIVSGDVDIFQLIENDKIVVYTMRRSLEDTILYNEEKVIERFGFEPTLLPDYKGLRGDTSDNIIGVPGIGEKTGSELIKHFGTLENLYKTIEKKDFVRPAFLKERVVELLKTHKEDALFSKELATIRRDASIEFELPEKSYAVNIEDITPLFTELGFTSLLKRISGKETLATPATLPFAKNNQSKEKETKNTVPIRNLEKNEKDFLSALHEREVFYLTHESLYLFQTKDAVWQASPEILDAFLKKNANTLKTTMVIGFDIKSLLKIAIKQGALLPQKYFDCGIAAWLSDSTLSTQTLHEVFLHILFQDEPADPFDQIGALPHLFEALQEKIKSQGLEVACYDIEMPLIAVLASMELNGIGVSREYLLQFQKEVNKKRGELEEKIYHHAGLSLNINSPQQIGELLFNKLALGGKKVRKTATGKLSTRESELTKLIGAHPVVPLILEYREIAKLSSTYIEPLLELSLHHATVHTTLNQTGTVTGRLSSDSPNLQNIPIRSALGARIRDAFVARSGFTLVALDYSQIELRILASLAEDQKMIQAFQKGKDIHRTTAAEINNISEDAVTPHMRDRAKAINFGIVFGMGVRQLAASTGMGQNEAQKFYEEYFRDFPAIRGYIDTIKQAVKKQGYVTTLFGRRRSFDLRTTRGNRFLESEMERMAVNAIIQGTDADIMKQAMIRVHQEFSEEHVRPILQIHDEMIYEIRDAELEKVIPKMKEIMEYITSLSVPLTVAVKVGKRWGSLVHRA